MKLSSLRRFSITRLRHAIVEQLPEAIVEPGVAFSAKLYFKHDDLELVICMPGVSRSELVKKVARGLQEHHHLYSHLSLTAGGRGANLKLRPVHQDYAVLVHFNRTDLIAEAAEVSKNVLACGELRYLMLFLLLFLRQRDLDNLNQGGVSLFLLHCVVLAFVRQQRAKILQTRGQKDLTNALLSEFCLKLLEFYGLQFDSQKQKIVAGETCRFAEKTHKDSGFSLVYPALGNNDLGQPAYKMREVFNCLKNRYFFLTNYNFVAGESVLKYLVNPSKADFKIYLK